MIEVRQRANQLLNQFNIDTLPVDVTEIAESLDCKIIKISPEELPEDFPCDKNNFAGALITNESEQEHFILVNKSDSLKRQKFTIAHELGHLVLGSENKIDCRESLFSHDDEELKANEFAGSILMPEAWLKSIISDVTNDNSKLADIFQVSLKSMEIRRNKLGI